MSRTQILDSFDRKLKALFGSKATSTPCSPKDRSDADSTTWT